MALFATERTSLASRLKVTIGTSLQPLAIKRHAVAIVFTAKISPDHPVNRVLDCVHRAVDGNALHKPAANELKKKVETPGSLYLVVLSSAVSVVEADLP